MAHLPPDYMSYLITPGQAKKIREKRLYRGYGFRAPAEHNAWVKHQNEDKARRKRQKKATLAMQRKARKLANA